MASVNIIGAGGHTRSLIALLNNQDYKVLGIYDDTYQPENEEIILGATLLGEIKRIPTKQPVVLAIGSNAYRKQLYQKFQSIVLKKTVIHSMAYIEESADIGKSNHIFANAFANALVKIGNNNIINSGAIIEHESQIGNHTHISVGAVIAGRCKIGNNCFIGAGATVIDKVSICDNVTIGAGGVVIRDITEPGTYVGNPVRKIA